MHHKERIRVLQVIPKLGTGGAERLVLDLAKHLDSRQFDVSIVSLYPFSGESFEMEAANTGLPIFYLSKRRGLDLEIFIQVTKLVKKFQPHVVHNHLYLLYTLLPACLLSRVPVRIHTVHSIATREVSGIHRYIHRCAFKHLKVIPVSISSIVLETIRDVYGIYESPVIYNGIDTDRFMPSEAHRRIWRLKNGIPEDVMVFVNIARFQTPKNHRLLIEAFYYTVQTIPNVMLLLVGDGELRSDISKIVNDKGLQNSVKFLGVRTDIPDILNATDVFVLSSDWEGLPISIIEAMAAGKPVITTDVGGVSELIINYRNGILVPRGDVQQLTEAMKKLAKDREMADGMGKQGRLMVREKFDVQTMARQYGELYLNCLLKHNRKNLEDMEP